jgi:hypothetical protein
MTSGANDAIPIRELAIWYKKGHISPADIPDCTFELIRHYLLADNEARVDAEAEFRKQAQIAGLQ